MSLLETIVAHKREEVAGRKHATPQSELISRLPGTFAVRDFTHALCDCARPAPRVIAEVKRRSPSRGILRPDLDPATLAQLYEQNGAAAISVLTDGRFFGGSLEDLSAVREAVDLPLLCKEFVIDPYQVYEARLAGADAVLLVAAILAMQELSAFRELATTLGMETLVEVHNRVELEMALASGATIVGINNRDLHTFTVSLDTTFDLRPLIPAGVVTVSESGISRREERAALAAAGIDALLVGESLLTALDTGEATRIICGVGSGALDLEASMP